MVGEAGVSVLIWTPVLFVGLVALWGDEQGRRLGFGVVTETRWRICRKGLSLSSPNVVVVVVVVVVVGRL